MTEERQFFSPYTQNSPYWIAVEGPDAKTVGRFGARELHDKPTLYGLKTSSDWSPIWNQLVEQAISVAAGSGLRAALIASDDMPSLQEIELSLRPVQELHSIARNIWLAQYVEQGRLVCFMQPVIDRAHQSIGHEAFARIEAPTGALIGGGAIMQASSALHVEFQIDRLMHKQAIEAYVESDFEGLAFINFLTGFIHQPDAYLEGLSQAVERHGIAPQLIALDVPLVDYAKDVTKLKSIAEYCHARGFILSLDDVMGPEGLAALLADIRPKVVKLDTRLATDMLDEKRRPAVLEIIRLAHEADAQVLAEGVESDALHEAYLAAGVDMFQGYLFGAPERCPRLPRNKRRLG